MTPDIKGGMVARKEKWPPKRIVALRKRLRETHDEFALRLGVNVRSLYRWEAGTTKPSRLAVRLLEGLEGLEVLERLKASR